MADHASDDERTDDLIEDEGNGEYIIRAVIEVEDGDKLTISGDEGVTENNYVHNNTIYDTEFGIMAFRSPFNTVANNIMDDIESYEYYVSRDSDLQIHNQTFSDDRIKGGSANSNHIEIINSGRISVGGDDLVINTDETPFTQKLESETITVDSAG